MKVLIAAGLAGLALGALNGCSTMQDKSAMVKPMEVDDTVYIARVERLAMDRGVTVHWVNPPRKRPVTEL